MTLGLWDVPCSLCYIYTHVPCDLLIHMCLKTLYHISLSYAHVSCVFLWYISVCPINLYAILIWSSMLCYRGVAVWAMVNRFGSVRLGGFRTEIGSVLGSVRGQVLYHVPKSGIIYFKIKDFMMFLMLVVCLINFCWILTQFLSFFAKILLKISPDLTQISPRFRPENNRDLGYLVPEPSRFGSGQKRPKRGLIHFMKGVASVRAEPTRFGRAR